MHPPCEQSGLSPTVIAKIGSVFARYPQVMEVRLYGSRARGNFGNGSDIDLSIMDEGVTNAQLLRMENEIDDLLLPYSVDLSLFHRIDNPGLAAHIQGIGQPFYRANQPA